MTIARTIAMILGGAGLTLLPGANGLTRALILMLSTGAAIVWTKVTGTSPLSLPGAIAKPIHSLTQYGLCTQASTPTPSAPVDIVCNNGALRYGAVGKNLYNVATDVNGYAIDAIGNVTAASAACYSALIPVTEGEYVYSGVCSTQGGSNNKRVHGYANGVWVKQLVMYIAPAGSAFSYVFTVPSGIDAIRISHWSEDAQTQVERGSTASDYEPFVGGIVADGTPEVLTISAVSSIQSENIVNAKGLDSRTGVVVSNSDRCYTMLGYYPAGTTIVQRATDNKLGGYLYMYNSDTPSTESFIGVESMSTAVEVDGWYERSATSTSDGYLFIQSLANKSASLGINWSATQPLQTVTDIPMLLSVGDYKDTVEIISGTLTRKVGVKILDGTEGWSFGVSSGWNWARMYLPDSKLGSSRLAVVCSHFEYPPTGTQYDDVVYLSSKYLRVYTDNAVDGTWQAWLAAQKAAGTPVIVIYPLSTETTEQTTPQPLSTVEGSNTLSWTAEVSGTVKEVEYAQAAPSGDNLVGTAIVGTAQAG